jgi:hypothetical protein
MYSTRTICFLIAPAGTASPARIHHRLDPRAITEFEVPYVLAGFDYNSGAFVAGGTDAEGGHGDAEVVEHVVDV